MNRCPTGSNRRSRPRGKPRNKWKIGCLTCGGLVVLVGVVLAILIPLSISNESRKTVTVHYSVTGDARGVSISYSHWSNGDWAVSETTATRLPWRKDESSTGLVRGGTLTVTTGASGGTATCSVAVDDGKPRTARATGPFSTAGCDGFNS